VVLTGSSTLSSSSTRIASDAEAAASLFDDQVWRRPHSWRDLQLVSHHCPFRPGECSAGPAANVIHSRLGGRARRPSPGFTWHHSIRLPCPSTPQSARTKIISFFHANAKITPFCCNVSYSTHITERHRLIDWVRLNVPPTQYRSYGDGTERHQMRVKVGYIMT